MKISTEIDSAARIIGEQKAVELIAKAGFDAWDFSMFQMAEFNWQKNCFSQSNHILASNNYLKFARELKNIGLDNGIVCNQSHAPFPSHPPYIFSYLKRAIECTAEAGGEICVIHPGCYWSPEQNAEFYSELLEFAKDYGVKIATENMYDWDNEKGHSIFAACGTPESFNAHLDAVNDSSLVACLDIGHAEMKGSQTSAAEMILALGDRLQALHIHDNDKLRDSHQIPFSMDIDFGPIVKALKAINYSGYFTLESPTFLKTYTKENVFSGIKQLADSAKKLALMFENP